jgi:hypothetical protein
MLAGRCAPRPAPRHELPPDRSAGWVETARRRAGPFTTHVTFRDEGGGTVEWASRSHRKHRSLLSRADARGGVWWAPRRASWWTASSSRIGSACFLVGAVLLLPEGAAEEGADARGRSG